jgi:hypothetical protein
MGIGIIKQLNPLVSLMFEDLQSNLAGDFE